MERAWETRPTGAGAVPTLVADRQDPLSMTEEPMEREKDPAAGSPSVVRKATTPEEMPPDPEVVRRTREGVCWGGVDASAPVSVCILVTSPGKAGGMGKGG